MDITSRVFFGVIVLAITGLVLNSPAYDGLTVLVMVILFIMGGVFCTLVFNPMGKISRKAHDQKMQDTRAAMFKRLYESEDSLKAQIAAYEYQLKHERAQKRRFITLWRKAKGYK